MRGNLNVQLPIPKPRTIDRLKHAYGVRFPGQNPHRTHFVYLVPSDKDPVAESAIERCARHLQRWYRWQMGNGKTFQLCEPIVETHRTAHLSSWYSMNNAGGDFRWWYWANVQTDLRDYAGGGFYQPFDDWVCYVDANPADGQGAGGTVTPGGFSGLCVLGAKDCASVMGIDPEWSLCRGIGGCGHELGHTYGLPHPEGDPNWGRAIMGTGYMTYPEDILLPADIERLGGNPFFAPRRQELRKLDVCVFPESRRPPHPTPQPRPK